MIGYEEIQTTIVVILAFAAVIITIDKVVEIMNKLQDPQKNILARLDDHDRMLDNDHMQIQKQDEAIKLLLRGVSQLITHELDGNHTDQLANTRDDMNEFLINKM